jgi:flagellar motor protein MotB
MPWIRRTVVLAALLIPVTGCQQGPFAPHGQANLQQIQTQNQTLIADNQRLVEEHAKLDRDNQEHSKLLAQSQQQLQQRDNENALLRNQLHDVTSQLAQVQSQKSDVENQAQALLASARRNGGATIRANNTLRASLPQFSLPEIQARVDGDLIRITIPTDRIFQQGSTQLTADAPGIIDSVAAEIARRYPEQVIGIEGHTDSDQGAWSAAGAPSMSTGHQLSMSQAGAVYEQIVSRGRLRAGQMFVTGYGANFPLYSNADPAGRNANRRIELVVYPDRPGG